MVEKDTITIAGVKIEIVASKRTEREQGLWDGYDDGYKEGWQAGHNKGFKAGWRAKEKHIKDGIDEGGKQ